MYVYFAKKGDKLFPDKPEIKSGCVTFTFKYLNNGDHGTEKVAKLQ